MERVLETEMSMADAGRMAVRYRSAGRQMKVPPESIKVGKVKPSANWDRESWGAWLVTPDPG